MKRKTNALKSIPTHASSAHLNSALSRTSRAWGGEPSHTLCCCQYLEIRRIVRSVALYHEDDDDERGYGNSHGRYLGPCDMIRLTITRY